MLVYHCCGTGAASNQLFCHNLPESAFKTVRLSPSTMLRTGSRRSLGGLDAYDRFLGSQLCPQLFCQLLQDVLPHLVDFVRSQGVILALIR